MNSLGEIFFNGKVIDLANAEITELQEVLMGLRNDKNNIKEKLERTLVEMREF